MIRLYTALPWLWIASGAGACALLAAGISGLAHAGGPDTGGALLLIALFAALFPLALAFVFTGLVLLAGGRLFAQVVSVIAIALCGSALLAAPPAVILLAPLMALPIATMWVLRSDEVREHLALAADRRAERLRRIAAGEETPPIARWLSLAWRTFGVLLLLGLPMAFSLPASDDRDLLVLYEVLSLPLGVAIFVTGRRLEKPLRSTLRWARIWSALLLLSTPLLGLSSGLKLSSAVAFFAVASWWALGLDEVRAVAARAPSA